MHVLPDRPRRRLREAPSCQSATFDDEPDHGLADDRTREPWRRLLIEGRWCTGSVISAAEYERLMVERGMTVEITLLPDPIYWGAEIDDERYIEGVELSAMTGSSASRIHTGVTTPRRGTMPTFVWILIRAAVILELAFFTIREHRSGRRVAPDAVRRRRENTFRMHAGGELHDISERCPHH